jgi:small subunit ribosomal protein S18
MARVKKSFKRKKICRFCADKIDAADISYKDVQKLKHYTTERGKIIPRRISGNCAKHQRALSMAIKRARAVAFMPFSAD